MFSNSSGNGSNSIGLNRNQIKLKSVTPFSNSITSNSTGTSSNKELNQVYYAKLVNFDRHCRLNSNQFEKKVESQLKKNNKTEEIDFIRRSSCLNNVSKTDNDETEYESLTNLDPCIETKLTATNEDSRSTSSCSSTSVEKIIEDDDNEDDFNEQNKRNTSSINQTIRKTSKSIKKINLNKTTNNKYSNSTGASSVTSSGSFSSSSASSISSNLSSIALNNKNQSSSASSSSSSSPKFLSQYSANTSHLNELISSLYSSNYKVRSKISSNKLLKSPDRSDVIRSRVIKESIEELTRPLCPSKPLTPPPPLHQHLNYSPFNNQKQQFKLNSNSATITKTTMSSWLQSNLNTNNVSNINNTNINKPREQLTEIETNKLLINAESMNINSFTETSPSVLAIDPSLSVVSTNSNNKVLASQLMKYSDLNAHIIKLNVVSDIAIPTSTDIINYGGDSNKKYRFATNNGENYENFYCDLSEVKKSPTINSTSNPEYMINKPVVYRNNNSNFKDTKSEEPNHNNKREFFVLNEKNDVLSQCDECEENEVDEKENDNTTTTEEITDMSNTNKKDASSLSRNCYLDSTMLRPFKELSSEVQQCITSVNPNDIRILSNNKNNTKLVTKKPPTDTSTGNSSIKSASTSYLLSKITSFASLTMPKHQRTSTTTTPAIIDAAIKKNINENFNNNPASPTSTSSSSSSSANPLSNLANITTKFFNRKLQQSSESEAYLMTSSNNNSIGSSLSPYLFDETNCRLMNKLTMSTSTNVNKYSSSSSSSNITFNQHQANIVNANITTSSRRPFKKRSQSIHNTLINSSVWYYNQNDDCWYKTLPLIDSNSSSPKTLSSTLKKRKSLNNKIAMTAATNSMSSFNMITNSNVDNPNQCISPCSFSLPNSNSVENCRVRLISISIKNLTILEQKYLKQIAFNNLQQQFQSLQLEEQKQRKQLLNKTTNSNASNIKSSNSVLNNNIFSVRLSIPKDESIKTTKIKSIALRSKSVDFKFFDEFKENYFSKKSSNPNQQVFGQSLYKCILNDLEQSSRRNSCAPASNQTSKSSLLKHQSENENAKISKKWRSSNKSNLLIASKFDLNLLNEINGNDNLAVNLDKNVNSPVDLSLSKRNSVLFEALDLKNLQNKPFINKNNLSKMKNSQLRSSSISSNLLPPFAEKKEDFFANNQNLSIRSEGLVPNIVKSCCDHISEYGLDVVGIFRIDSSKKRIKEIKELFDTGKDVVFNESFNPNDSACILKEYLRSLPEPLLTRDLYSSFLATCKINETDKRLQAVRYLICLLPVPNRDTLEILLKLLDKIKSYSNQDNQSLDTSKKTTTCSGNKMDAFNLAMVFGPNILKKYKLGSNPSTGDFHSDKYNLIDDIDSVICVTKYLIENQNSLFEIDSNLHNELIQTMSHLNPVEVNAVFTRKLISSIGVFKLDSNLNGDNSDTSGYSSSAKSSSQMSKLRTDDSLSPLNCLSTGIMKSNNNQYIAADFIDYNLSKHRTSRTKLHKIADNINYIYPKETESINFINSPSHSPTQAEKNIKQIKHESSYIYGSNHQIMKTFSNEIYNNQIIDSYLNPTTVNNNSCKPTTNNNPISSSSLLLMIQSNEKNSNKSKHKKNINENNLSDDLLTKATKSLSNLNQQQASALGKRRQSGPTIHANKQYQTQYKVVNSNTIQICSKFYDKSKYNIIGEQETLV